MNILAPKVYFLKCQFYSDWQVKWIFPLQNKLKIQWHFIPGHEFSNHLNLNFTHSGCRAIISFDKSTTYRVLEKNKKKLFPIPFVIRVMVQMMMF